MSHPAPSAPHGAYQYYRRAQMDGAEAAVPESSDVDRALAELAREPYAELTIEGGRQFAHGTGPLAQHDSGPTIVEAGGRRKVEFPKVHPSLRHVLSEVEVDSELDVPTFLRRASE